MVDISAKHLEGPDGWLPLTQNTFSLEIAAISELRLAVQSVPFPNITIEKNTISFLNRKIHYPVAVEYDDMDVTVIDYVDSSVADKIYEWYTDVYNPDTDAFQSGYKKSGELLQLGPDFEKVRTWKLSGLFPTSIDFGEGDMTAQGEPVNVTMTLSVDKVVMA